MLAWLHVLVFGVTRKMKESIHAPQFSTLASNPSPPNTISYRLLSQSRLPSGAFKKPPRVGCAPLRPSHSTFHVKIFSFLPPSTPATPPSGNGIAANGAQPREASGGQLRLSTAARTSRWRMLWLCTPVTGGALLLLSPTCWQYMHDGWWRCHQSPCNEIFNRSIQQGRGNREVQTICIVAARN